MKAALVVFLLLAGVGVCPGLAGEPATKAAEAPWPLWDGKETVAEYAKRAGLEPTLTLKLSDKVSLESVLIPAGKFLMGSPATEKERELNEGLRHEVTITRPFYMGKYEVTQEQYEAVTSMNPSFFNGKISATVEMPARKAPGILVLRFRHPRPRRSHTAAGCRIKAARSGGKR
jgi:hypothetical protein